MYYNDYTIDDENYIASIMEIISVPTKYLTPKGIIEIDFDIDILEMALNKFNFGGHFHDHFSMFFLKYCSMIFFKYLKYY